MILVREMGGSRVAHLGSGSVVYKESESRAVHIGMESLWRVRLELHMGWL